MRGGLKLPITDSPKYSFCMHQLNTAKLNDIAGVRAEKFLTLRKYCRNPGTMACFPLRWKI